MLGPRATTGWLAGRPAVDRMTWSPPTADQPTAAWVGAVAGSLGIPSGRSGGARKPKPSPQCEPAPLRCRGVPGQQPRQLSRLPRRQRPLAGSLVPYARLTVILQESPRAGDGDPLHRRMRQPPVGAGDLYPPHL